MPKAVSQKLSLASPETIPLDRLEIHEDNVRKSDVDEATIIDLAADIASRGLLQSLSVRPVLDDDGQESGRYGIQAGSRRFRALKLLVRQKKLAKNAPIPCIMKRDGFAEADSLSENIQRVALTPLDEFRAFKSMADKGLGEETIAAAFRVSTLVVRQRLRLANASPVILKAYEEDEISLEQLMAYCVTDDHARQEQVFAAIGANWNRGAEHIRRMLTEKSVPTGDERAVFIGADAYLAAGGFIERDLFAEDDSGYMLDVALVQKLVAQKLAAEAEKIRAEGWAWVEHCDGLPWQRRHEFRAIAPIQAALSDEEEVEYENLAHELDELESVAEDDLASDDRGRLASIKATIAEFGARLDVYSDEQKAKAGAFLSLNYNGSGVIVERGYMRLADFEAQQRHSIVGQAADGNSLGDGITTEESRFEPSNQDSEDSADLPEKLLTELTAYHSLGLRNAVASNHRVAYLAILNALVLDLFYQGYTSNNCLQIWGKDNLVISFPGLAEFKAAREIEARHAAFQKVLPEDETQLWDALQNLNPKMQDALFAHCAGLTVNAVYEGNGRSNKRRHALQLAEVLSLDMRDQGFVTNAENYFGRITKHQILEKVAEAKGPETADLLADLKKKDMAAESARLLGKEGWLPEPLRTPEKLDENDSAALPAFLEEPALQAAE
jgi:ParB family transcriptional regulator, chromosome partitioning protein